MQCLDMSCVCRNTLHMMYVVRKKRTDCSLIGHTMYSLVDVPFSFQLDGSMAGDKGFDPLGLSTIDDVGIDLYWLREAEIKHARVAMLAVAGALQVEVFGPAPGCEMATAKCQTDAFWQIWSAHPQYIAASLVLITIVEAVSGIAATTGRESGDRAPGDFGLDPLGFCKGDVAKADRLKLQEIENGRLAMWAAMGLLVQGSTNHMGGLEALGAALNDNSF